MTTDDKPDLIPEMREVIDDVLERRNLPPLTPAELANIDRQIAVVDAQRIARRERRFHDEPVEVERRAGYDRRHRTEGQKG